MPSPSGGEEETSVCSVLTGDTRTCKHQHSTVMCLHVSGSGSTQQRWIWTEPHTWLTVTTGSVSLAGFRLDVILVTTAGCGGGVRPGGLTWAPPPVPEPWRAMGL